MYIYTDEQHIVPVAQRLSLNLNPVEACIELAAAVAAEGVYTDADMRGFMVVPAAESACDAGNTASGRLATICNTIAQEGAGRGGETDPNQAWTEDQIYVALAVESCAVAFDNDYTANITSFLDKISDKSIFGLPTKNDILQEIILQATALMTP